MTGYVLAPSERSDITIHAAKRFGLDKEGTVLMTDQASSFTTAALNLKKNHLLCLHHFRTTMFSAHAGMSQEKRNCFLQSCNRLIFHVFESVDAFDSEYHGAQSNFAEFPAACKFLKSLWDNRDRICAVFFDSFHSWSRIIPAC